MARKRFEIDEDAWQVFMEENGEDLEGFDARDGDDLRRLVDDLEGMEVILPPTVPAPWVTLGLNRMDEDGYQSAWVCFGNGWPILETHEVRPVLDAGPRKALQEVVDAANRALDAAETMAREWPREEV